MHTNTATFKQFTENLAKNISLTLITATFKQFTENWQKALSSTGLEQDECIR